MNMFTGADVKESLDQLAADFDSNHQKNYAGVMVRWDPGSPFPLTGKGGIS